MSQRSWVRYAVWPHTFVSPSTDSRRAVVSFWQKYMHKVLVNCLRGLSLPRKSVVRLTDHPDMTLGVYCGRKTTTQQQLQMYYTQQHYHFFVEKTVKNFCNAKVFHSFFFFWQKNKNKTIDFVSTVTYNEPSTKESFTNDIIKLTTLFTIGPKCDISSKHTMLKQSHVTMLAVLHQSCLT